MSIDRNWSDEECRSDYHAERPEPDLPAPSELDHCLQHHICRSTDCWICDGDGPPEGF